MEKKYSVVYISLIPQEQRVNVGVNTAEHLSKYAKVIHFAITDEPIPFRKLFFPQNTLKVLKSLYSTWRDDFSDWIFFEPCPFKRVKSIEKLNYELNILLIKLFLKKDRKLVVITRAPTPEARNFIKNIKPDLAIGDCIDIWSKKDSMRMRGCTDYVLTNAIPLYENQKRYGRTHLIPAGYFSKKTIEALRKIDFTKGTSKTVLFIGTITWRINGQRLLRLADEMDDLKFVFVGTELFDYNLENKAESFKKRDEITQKQWKTLQIKPNVECVEMVNQEVLPSLDIKANIGIITADPEIPFNKYSHPLKIYHYFSMGLPVVSTKIKSILQYRSKFVQFADNDEQFRTLIRKLSTVRIPKREREKMVRLAKKHTYEEKAKSIMEIIDKEVKKHREK